MAYCLLLSFFLLSVSLHPPSVLSSGGFSTDLIHRDSLNSPFYTTALSSDDCIRAAARRSFDRARFMRSIISSRANGSSSPSDFHSEVIPNQFEYLMTLNIGTPPFKILAIADTGSDLTWTQCKPCFDCYKQEAPIFNPRASSTYGTVSCNAISCSQLPYGRCGPGSSCGYQYSYGDQSYTVGVLSVETVTFDTNNKRRPVSFPKILFGCSHESKGTFDKQGAGLVGLGGGPLSLVSQLGPKIDKKFSYCLVPYHDSNKSTSRLNFGHKANVVGPNALTTPLIPRDPDTFYYLQLKEISVGSEKVATVRKSSQGNIIIDSGTTLTMLPSSVLQPVVDKLSAVVKYPKVRDPEGLFSLCFDISKVSGDKLDIPDITFKFTGAAVVLPPLNTFVQPGKGMLCLAIVSGDSQGLSIYGNVAQQNFHIGYDLRARKLSIAPANCAKL